jgi:hypothetical protein
MKKLPIEFFEKSRPHATTLYEIKYLLETGVSMEEWLDDFIVWLDSRDETIMGTIEPYTNEKEN